MIRAEHLLSLLRMVMWSYGTTIEDASPRMYCCISHVVADKAIKSGDWWYIAKEDIPRPSELKRCGVM